MYDDGEIIFPRNMETTLPDLHGKSKLETSNELMHLLPEYELGNHECHSRAASRF
jgi:hypothetical protein